MLENKMYSIKTVDSGKCTFCNIKVCDLCAIGGDEMMASERKCPDCFEKELEPKRNQKPEKKKKKVAFKDDEETEEQKENNIKWGCLGETAKDKETKSVINNLLPNDVEVLITECEMKENSINGVKEESKFNLKLEAKICKMEEAEAFINNLEKRTQCKYNKRGRDRQGKKDWIFDKRQCQFNVQSKLNKEDDNITNKHKVKPGRKEGKPTHPNKQFFCPATLQYRLKICKECSECQNYNLTITLQQGSDV